MAGAWKPGKTNDRFSPVPTPPWESGKPRRIPTFPPRRPPLPLLRPKRQKQERKSAAARPPHSDCFQDHVVLETLPVSGSSDDWKMLKLLVRNLNRFRVSTSK